MLSESYDAFLEYSILDFGNNSKIKSVLRRARAGEELTIAFLGGSITERYNGGREGCYGKVFTKKFSGEYSTSDKIRFINAGLAGTDSLMGLIRAERDVLQYIPDMIFVEFAVNDSKDSLHREAYESLLRRLIRSGQHPAVILIFVRAEAGYTCQGQMQAAGEHYHLPMVSIADAITRMLSEDRMLWSDYADDYIHPHKQGNVMIADCLMRFLRRVEEQEQASEDLLVEDALYGAAYCDMKLLDTSNVEDIDFGDFVPEKTAYQFPCGWNHPKSGGDKPFRLNIKAKHLFVIYREINDVSAGSAEVLIDGVRLCALDSYQSTGWDNPAIRHILSRPFAEEHRIEIKMSPGEGDKEFAIFALGYCD
jgi:lysophospholipase L1-like esterase